MSRPIDEWIQKFKKAKRTGDKEGMQRYAAEIDSMQRSCLHPPNRLKLCASRIPFAKGSFGEGVPILICLECSRLLTVNGAPYRYEMDTDESWEKVIEARNAYEIYLDSPAFTIMPPWNDPPEEEPLELLDRPSPKDKKEENEPPIVKLEAYLHHKREPTTGELANALRYLCGYIEGLQERIGFLEKEADRTVKK